jgi:hypothetical protein
MKQKSIVILILFFLVAAANAQENVVSIRHIKAAKDKIVYPAGKRQIIPGDRILQVSGSESILQNRPGQITLDLEDVLPDHSDSLHRMIPLVVYDVCAPKASFTSGTKEGDVSIDSPFANYKGRINEDDWINLSFSRAGIIGWIRSKNRTFVIQPDPSGNATGDNKEHFMNELSNENQEGNWCGLNTGFIPAEILKLMTSLDKYILARSADTKLMATKSADARLTARIALETDYETYVGFGSDVNLATSWLLSIAASVSQIYEQQVDVALEVVYTRVWTTADDPYTQKGFSLMPEFQTFWNTNMQSVDRDVAVLVIKDPTRLAGGLASLDALGNIKTSYAISGENIITVAHELGHIFGSPHTHSCSWPAGPGSTLAPIDQCATVEGDCDIKEVIPQEGTIMSYCPTTTQTFGTLVGNLIRARAEAKLGTGDLFVSNVTGKVTLSGTGLANAAIRAYRADGTDVSTTTATDGTFSLDLFYSEYTIIAEQDGYLVKPAGRSSGYLDVTVADTKVTGLNFEARVLAADPFEPDDNIGRAVSIPADGTTRQHTLHTPYDTDFAQFNAVSGKSYLLALKLEDVLASPTLSLLDTDGITSLQDASYPPSMVWKAPQTGT